MKFQKIRKKLRLVIRTIVLSCFLGCSWFSYGQTNTPLSVYADSLPLKNVILDIEKQANIHFAYDPNFIKNKYVSISEDNVTLNEILPIVFRNTGICYKESEANHYLLYPCQEKKWSINGRVQDGATGEFLPFANITILNKGVGTISNEEGRFSFLDLKENSVTLQLHYIGYQVKEISISNTTTTINILMDKKSVLIEGYEVEGYMEFVNTGKYFGQLTINPNLLKGFPSLGESDPIKSVRLLPGVGGNAETSTGIAMRGGKFDQTMILFDDFQVFHVDHFFGLFSTINQNMVKDIQVYRSGYSAKYSGFVSGLVQISGKDGNMKKVSGGVLTNIYSSSAYFEAPLIKDKWSMALSFRKDNFWINNDLWNDKIGLPHIEDEVRAKSPSSANAEDIEGNISFHDASFKTNYRLSDKHSFTLSYFNSNDRVETVYNKPLDPEEESISQLDLSSSWSNHGLSAKWSHELSKNYSAKLVYSYSKFGSRTNFNNILEIFEDDTLENFQDIELFNNFTRQNYRYDIELKRPSSIWYLGVDMSLFNFELNNGNTAEEFDEEDEEDEEDFEPFDLYGSKFLPAIYVEYKSNWTKKLEVLIGTRLTYESEEERPYLEPRFSANYKINEPLRATVSYGYYYQYAKQFVPDIREGLIPDYWLLPDYEQSFPTKAHLASFGLNYNKNNWMINTEFFYKDINHTAEQFPSISDLLSSSDGFVKALSTGRSKVIGADLTIRKRYKRTSIWLGFGMANVNNTSDSVQTGIYQPYYANLGDIKLGYIYNWKKWEAGLTWVWQGGRSYTKISQEIENLNTLVVGNAKLPDYHRMDASISYKITLKKVSGAIRFTIFNLYNRKNLRTINYTELENSTSAVPQAVPISTLGFSPNLTLEVNF